MQAYTIAKTSQALLLVAGFAAVLFFAGHRPADAAESATGRPGETFTVNVERAPRGREVTAELAGSTASAVVDRTGRLRLDIAVPEVPEGDYSLRLRGAVVRNLPFRVLAAPSPATSSDVAASAAPALAEPALTAASATRSVPADLVAVIVGSVLAASGVATLIAIVVAARRRRPGPPPAVASPLGPPVVNLPLPWADGERTMPLRGVAL